MTRMTTPLTRYCETCETPVSTGEYLCLTYVAALESTVEECEECALERVLTSEPTERAKNRAMGVAA